MPPIQKPRQDESYTEQELASAISQMTQEIGRSGTEIYSGYINEDDNPIFNDIRRRCEIVDKMRKQDTAVSAGLKLIYSPILSAEYYIEGDNDEHNQFIKKNLFDMQKRTWIEFIREATAYLAFGFYPFEKVYKIGKDGLVHLDDLAPRIPRSVEKFQRQDGGYGLTQNVFGDLSREISATQVSIPVDKLLIFTNDKEGDDISGTSLLRPAYRHYLMKGALYDISIIAAERYGAGTPKGTIKEGGRKEKEKLIEALKNLRSNEKSYIVTYDDAYDIEILTPSGNPMGSMMENLINHHNRMILFAMLAHSLDLGSQPTGSYALSSNQKGDLMGFVSDKLAYMMEQIQRQVIKPLVKLNFGEQETYPTIKFAKLGDINHPEVAGALSQLVSAGLIKVTPKTTQLVHKQFDLNQISDEQVTEMEIEEAEAAIAAMEAEQDEADADIDSLFAEPEQAPEEEIEEETI